MTNVSQLIDLIHLEQLEDQIFKGRNEPIGSPSIFGGQVIAQAVYAMSQSVPKGRFCNSYHCYFILPGDLKEPVYYEVETIRDGGSFSVRRVKAEQKNRVIFFMGASFQGLEEGYNHQLEMPKVPHHEGLYSWDQIYEQLKGFLPKSIEKFFSIERPITFKPTVVTNPVERKKLDPFQNIWFKIKGEMENDPIYNRSILSYISDYNILTTALHPHADVAHFGNTQMATLDHSMWFFRECDINEWMLFSIESPSASGARGFARGNIFSESGQLIASVTQEGLMRPKN